MNIEKLLKFGFHSQILRMPAGAAGAGTLNGAGTAENGGFVDDNSNPSYAKGGVDVDSMSSVNGLLDKDIEQLITKVRPYDNPVDTIVRELGSEEDCSSFEVESGQQGTLPLIDSASSISTGKTATVKVANINMWMPHDTFMVHTTGFPMYYVASTDVSAGTLTAIALDGTGLTTAISTATNIQRIATAVNERQAMLQANELLPDIRTNYCQIFMKTMAMGTIAQLHKKRVNLDFSSIKEQELWDFRRQIESAFTFGVMSKINDSADRNKVVYTCGGLWNQLDHTFALPATMTDKTFVDITEEAFVGNNGSDTKILLAGHGLMSELMKSATYSRQMEQGNVEIVAGIKFNKIVTNHGTLLIKPHDLFIGSHYFDGMVLDPSYLVKKYYKRLTTDSMDLLKAGLDRADSETIYEISTIFAKNLPTHLKISGAALNTSSSTTGSGNEDGVKPVRKY